MVACEIANPLIRFPSLPEYSLSQAAIGPPKPSPLRVLLRSGQNDNQMAYWTKHWAWNWILCLRTRRSLSLTYHRAPTFSFSIIMIERHCSDALRNLFEVVCA